MDIWCQHVKWKKPSMHCLQCLNGEVDKLTEYRNKHENEGVGECPMCFVEAKNTKFRKALENAKIPHRIVDEDCFYSCPKSGECCNDGFDGYCNCGADKHNKAIDDVLKTTS